jgi:hypothetical protein
LHGSLSGLLSIHLQNFQIASFIIRTIKTYDQGHPLAPQPEEIPEFLGLQMDSLPIDSLLPVQELLGDEIILHWVMLVLSDVTLEAKDGEFQIRQPTAAYYRKPVDVDLNEAVSGLTNVMNAWNSRIAPHFALLDRLNDLDRHVGQKRPWNVGGYYVMKNRPEVMQIVADMKSDFEKVQKARDDAEPILRSGGLTK